MCRRKEYGRPKTSEETVERVCKKSCKVPKIATKNKSVNPDSTNNSLAHHEETTDNETLQATTRSGHNCRGQGKAQIELTCAMYQASTYLKCVKLAMKSTYL